MNIYVICVGKIKESFVREEIKEYEKRLSRYCHLKIIEVDESKLKDSPSDKEIQKALDEEANKLLSYVDKNAYMVLLDLHGKEMDSIKFSETLDNLEQRYTNYCFVIGSSYGVSEDLRKRANLRLCLSQMTFTNQMSRVIILEQIYRSFKIRHHETYHK